jgi:hypothetical protein
MKINRIYLLINCLWEGLRFLLLFFALSITFQRLLLADPQAIFWLVLAVSGSLLLPAALLFLYLAPQRNLPLLKLVRLGKILGLVATLLLLFMEPFEPGLSASPAVDLPIALTPFSVVLAVTVVDLVFVFLLLAYRLEEQREGTAGGDSGEAGRMRQLGRGLPWSSFFRKNSRG